MTQDQTPDSLTVELPADYDDAVKYPTADRRDGAADTFDWQVLPENLKTEDPAGFQKIRLTAVLEMVKFEVSDLPFQHQGQHRLKMRNVVNFIDNTRNYLIAGMQGPARRLFDHWVDNLGAIAWNVLDGLFKARDQRVFLHMVNLYNAGAFTLPGLNKPLNACSWAEVQAAEHEEERLYWQHQQREGLFLPLGPADLRPKARDTQPDELTLDDFVVARKQVDKAVLIVFEAADGTRYVLKDLTGAPAAPSEAELTSATLDAQIDE
ncbi:MAG: hypothetical protein NVS3B25_33550 [Hymenobacter sp.]